MRTCTIDISEKEYKLCLNREAIKWLENKGIDISKVDSKIFTTFEGLWTASFLTNNGDLTEKETVVLMDKYIEEDGDVGEVIQFLVEEYGNFIRALTDTESKKKKKKAKIDKA